jgi:hypothetical protein
MEDGWRHEPAGSGFEALGGGEVENSVVALVPVGDASADLILGGIGVKAEKRVGEIIADVVVLGRKIIGLGFSFLANERGLLRVLVHVMRNWPHVVEELGVHGPASVFAPDGLADKFGSLLGNRISQRKALTVVYDIV